MNKTVTIREYGNGDCECREVPLEDISDAYHYDVTIRELSPGAVGDVDYSVRVSWADGGEITGAGGHDGAIENAQTILERQSERRQVVRDQPAARKVGPIPVTLDTVTVHDETDLGIAASDVVPEQASLDDYAVGGGDDH